MNTTTNNTGFSMFSQLPTTEYLYSLSIEKVGFKNVISLTHFLKVVGEMHPS